MPKVNKTSNPSQIKFGTDGWRGVISEDFTFDNLRAVSQAISDYINSDLSFKESQKIVAVGYDTRFLSDKFAQAVAEVLAANKIKVIISLKPIPTPLLSFTVKRERFSLGIMITASHNPAEFNGLKIKKSTGSAADKKTTEKIEKYLFKNRIKRIPLDVGLSKKLIVRKNFDQPYIRFLRNYIDENTFKVSKISLIVDVMYGSGSDYLERVLVPFGIKPYILHKEINPYFGGVQPEPVERNLKQLKNIMQKKNFSLGLVLDGDADRIAAFAPGGKFIHPQKILGLLLLHLVKNRGFSGGVVKTIVGTNLIERIAHSLKIPVFETPIGFKYISQIMEKEEIILGGEEAGGIGFKNYIPERDGTLAGLLLLEMVLYQKKSINSIVEEMEKEFGRFFYLRKDFTILRRPKPLLSKKEYPNRLLNKKIIEIKDFDGIKFICEDESWLMLRASGTEPLVRVYAESDSLTRSKELIKLGKELLQKKGVLSSA